MTIDPITLDELEETRRRLIDELQARLDVEAKHVLLTLHDGQPDFSAIARPQAADLPAVRWKLRNLERLRDNDPDKHARQRIEIVSL